MDIEKPQKNKAELLQQELEMRGKYYFKGFQALLQGILSDLEYFLNSSNSMGGRSAVRIHLRDLLKLITKLYQSIPFERITDHPDYDLLSVVKEAVTQLVPKIEAVLSEEKGNFEEIHKIIKTISEKGREYRMRLITVKKQLNLQHGHEHDGLKKADIHGVVWNSVV